MTNGTSLESKENVLRLVLMVNLVYHVSPMLSQGIRQQCAVCVQRLDSESVNKHAQSCCVLRIDVQ